MHFNVQGIRVEWCNSVCPNWKQEHGGEPAGRARGRGRIDCERERIIRGHERRARPQSGEDTGGKSADVGGGTLHPVLLCEKSTEVQVCFKEHAVLLRLLGYHAPNSPCLTVAHVPGKTNGSFCCDVTKASSSPHYLPADAARSRD